VSNLICGVVCDVRVACR